VPNATETRYIGMAVWKQDWTYRDYINNTKTVHFLITVLGARKTWARPKASTL